MTTPVKKISTLTSKNLGQSKTFVGNSQNQDADSDLIKKKKPKNISLPSRFIYAADVPEVKKLQSKFVYNFYVPNECILDSDILSDSSLLGANISTQILDKKGYEFSDDDLNFDRSKLPRYVKLNFIPPPKENIPHATSQESSVISSNFNSIMKEENFSTSFFSSLNFDNNQISSQTNVLFNNPDDVNSNYAGVNEKESTANSIIQQSLSSNDLMNNTIFVKGNGEIVANSYLENLKKLSTSIQVNNAVLHDMVVSSAGNPLTLNSEKFKKYIPKSSSDNGKINDYKISDEDYETSIDYYKIVTKTDNTTPASYKLLGYYIDKKELFLDGTIKEFSPIVIENPAANSFVDFDVRYGTTYIYEVRSVVELTYTAVDNETYSIFLISSLIASRASRTLVETTENIAPPPPEEVTAMWDYNKINVNTTQYDSVTDKPYPNTGKYGSLLITWSFPVNSQMDIKKFQLFRRKSVNDSFELIKMFDFNDAVFRFPLLEERINKNVIEYLINPRNMYYDYDFYKNSEYIYALAAIDAHGLSSNYSSQVLVKFDEYANKIVVDYISKAGAPKQYPNMFLNKDLFIDTIKTSTKRTMHMYLDPDCYSVMLSPNSELKVLKTNPKEKYIINFINIENQKSSYVEMNVADKRSIQTPLVIPPIPEDGNSAAELIEKSKLEAKIAANKKPKV